MLLLPRKTQGNLLVAEITFKLPWTFFEPLCSLASSRSKNTCVRWHRIHGNKSRSNFGKMAVQCFCAKYDCVETAHIMGSEGVLLWWLSDKEHRPIHWTENLWQCLRESFVGEDFAVKFSLLCGRIMDLKQCLLNSKAGLFIQEILNLLKEVLRMTR